MSDDDKMIIVAALQCYMMNVGKFELMNKYFPKEAKRRLQRIPEIIRELSPPSLQEAKP
jgi:hypothetical protein